MELSDLENFQLSRKKLWSLSSLPSPPVTNDTLPVSVLQAEPGAVAHYVWPLSLGTVFCGVVRAMACVSASLLFLTG
jgi:hypothetical protein